MSAQAQDFQPKGKSDLEITHYDSSKRYHQDDHINTLIHQLRGVRYFPVFFTKLMAYTSKEDLDKDPAFQHECVTRIADATLLEQQRAKELQDEINTLIQQIKAVMDLADGEMAIQITLWKIRILELESVQKDILEDRYTVQELLDIANSFYSDLDSEDFPVKNDTFYHKMFRLFALKFHPHDLFRLRLLSNTRSLETVDIEALISAFRSGTLDVKSMTCLPIKQESIQGHDAGDSKGSAEAETADRGESKASQETKTQQDLPKDNEILMLMNRFRLIPLIVKKLESCQKMKDVPQELIKTGTEMIEAYQKFKEGDVLKIVLDNLRQEHDVQDEASHGLVIFKSKNILSWKMSILENPKIQMDLALGYLTIEKLLQEVDEFYETFDPDQFTKYERLMYAGIRPCDLRSLIDRLTGGVVLSEYYGTEKYADCSTSSTDAHSFVDLAELVLLVREGKNLADVKTLPLLSKPKPLAPGSQDPWIMYDIMMQSRQDYGAQWELNHETGKHELVGFEGPQDPAFVPQGNAAPLGLGLGAGYMGGAPVDVPDFTYVYPEGPTEIIESSADASADAETTTLDQNSLEPVPSRYHQDDDINTLINQLCGERYFPEIVAKLKQCKTKLDLDNDKELMEACSHHIEVAFQREKERVEPIKNEIAAAIRQMDNEFSATPFIVNRAIIRWKQNVLRQKRVQNDIIEGRYTIQDLLELANSFYPESVNDDDYFMKNNDLYFKVQYLLEGNIHPQDLFRLRLLATPRDLQNFNADTDSKPLLLALRAGTLDVANMTRLPIKSVEAVSEPKSKGDSKESTEALSADKGDSKASIEAKTHQDLPKDNDLLVLLKKLRFLPTMVAKLTPYQKMQEVPAEILKDCHAVVAEIKKYKEGIITSMIHALEMESEKERLESDHIIPSFPNKINWKIALLKNPKIQTVLALNTEGYDIEQLFKAVDDYYDSFVMDEYRGRYERLVSLGIHPRDLKFVIEKINSDPKQDFDIEELRLLLTEGIDISSLKELPVIPKRTASTPVIDIAADAAMFGAQLRGTQSIYHPIEGWSQVFGGVDDPAFDPAVHPVPAGMVIDPAGGTAPPGLGAGFGGAPIDFSDVDSDDDTDDDIYPDEAVPVALTESSAASAAPGPLVWSSAAVAAAAGQDGDAIAADLDATSQENAELPQADAPLSEADQLRIMYDPFGQH